MTGHLSLAILLVLMKEEDEGQSIWTKRLKDGHSDVVDWQHNDR